MTRHFRTAYASLLLAVALPIAGETGVSLERLTSPEVRSAIANGTDTILVPIGGTEQNGPALVLGKHNVRARVLAEQIAARVGQALVAPVIAYVPEGRIDPPTGHMVHPGTITIPEDAFEKTVESAARSLRHHGFRHVVLLGDHGGYHRNLRKVADRLNREWRRTVVIIPEGYYRELPHAGAADASLSLALDPSLVRDAPAGTSAEAGQQAAEAIISSAAKAIRSARGR